MREILFRGKPIDDKDFLWVNSDGFVYGAPAVPYKTLFYAYYKPYKDDGDYSLVPIEVDPSTIGQYTGLTDKDGKKIFEGDIVHYIYDGGKENSWKADQNSIIKWDFSGFYMDGIFGSNKYACCSGWLENIACNGGKFFEVIGNIHDNPELLKGADT